LSLSFSAGTLWPHAAVDARPSEGGSRKAEVGNGLAVFILHPSSFILFVTGPHSFRGFILWDLSKRPHRERAFRYIGAAVIGFRAKKKATPDQD
jgi:hypothetical protein